MDSHLRNKSKAGDTGSTDGSQPLEPSLRIKGRMIPYEEFTVRLKNYFVPWQAYSAAGEDGGGAECSLGQDDLFVRLMQQEKQCAV